MSAAALSHYTAKFQSLHRASHPTLGRAPHKPILLLTILDMLDQGLLHDNLVRITPELVAAFRLRWRSLVTPNTWQERIVLPFRHLTFDGFWELVKNGVVVPPQQLGGSPSLVQLTNEIDGGRLSDDLWGLLQHTEARAVLRQILLDTYFHDVAHVGAEVFVTDAMTVETERLIAEAQATFRVRKPRSDAQEDGQYIRHALFPRVVKSLYDHTCAVCYLRISPDARSLVDAAHIVPFAVSHNDDPRNGLALCKNHHWGFDAGWFSASDDRCVVVSPRVAEASAFVAEDAPFLVPGAEGMGPAVEALRWHRANVLLR